MEAFTARGDALSRPHGNSYWLIPGRILAGEHPGAAGATTLVARLSALREVGVSTFVDLSSAADPVPAYLPLDTLAFPGQRLSHPIADFGVPAIEAMARIEADVERALTDGRALYLHCRAGIGRTGTIAACLMVSAGASADQSLAWLADMWQVVDKRFAEPHTPETEAQREFVRRWEDWVRRGSL